MEAAAAPHLEGSDETAEPRRVGEVEKDDRSWLF